MQFPCLRLALTVCVLASVLAGQDGFSQEAPEQAPKPASPETSTTPTPGMGVFHVPFPVYASSPEEHFTMRVEHLAPGHPQRYYALQDLDQYWGILQNPQLYALEPYSPPTKLIQAIRDAIRSRDPLIARWGLINLKLKQVPTDFWAEMLLPMIAAPATGANPLDTANAKWNRYAAVYLIGSSRDPKDRSRVIHCLASIMDSPGEDDIARFAAAQSLIQMEALPSDQINQTKDDDADRRVFRRAFEYLVGEAKNKKNDRRKAAIETLGHVDRVDDYVMGAILQVLGDPDRDIQAAAIQAIGESKRRLATARVVGAAIIGLTEWLQKQRVAKVAIPPDVNKLSPELLAISHVVRLTEIQRNQGNTSNLAAIRVAVGEVAKWKQNYREANREAIDQADWTHWRYDELSDALGSIEANRDSLASQQWREWMLGSVWIRRMLGISLLIVTLGLFFYLRPLTLLTIRQLCRESLWARILERIFMIRLDDVSMPRLLGDLVYHPRVLDAWVARRIKDARREFAQIPTVAKRKIHIPCPVRLGDQPPTMLTPAQLRQTFRHGKGCLLITGEGGAGKTSLACLVAGWAMSDDPAQRIAGHAMIPVLIERDLAGSAAGAATATDTVRQALRSLVGPHAMPDDELLVRLLQRGRILLVVDHLSEMSPETRKLIDPGRVDFPASALVVTTRDPDPENLRDVRKTGLRPVRLSTSRLGGFLDAYFTANQQRDLFDDQRFYGICQELATLVGTRDVTPLLAILYADQVVANPDNGSEDRPRNIPDLFLAYLRALAANHRDGRIDSGRAERDLKAIARECLKRFRPGPIDRNDAIRAIKDADRERRMSDSEERTVKAERKNRDVVAALQEFRAISTTDAEARLDSLEKQLRVIEPVPFDAEKVRVTFDPLAEYLAGMALVEELGQRPSAWKRFFEANKTARDSANSVSGKDFLRVVQDCCRARGFECPTPESALTPAGAAANETSEDVLCPKSTRTDPGHPASSPTLPREGASQSAGPESGTVG